MAYTDIWDATTPPDTQAANQLGLDIRNLKTDIAERIGSLSGLDVAKPALENSFAGALYWATDTGKVYQLANSGGPVINPGNWVEVTSSFFPNVNAASHVWPWFHTVFGGGTVVGAVSSEWMSCFGAVIAGTFPEAQAQLSIPASIVIKSLYARVGAIAADGAVAFSIRKNGVAGLTLGIPAGSAAGVYNTVGAMAFAPGDLISMLIANNSPTTMISFFSVVIGY